MSVARDITLHLIGGAVVLATLLAIQKSPAAPIREAGLRDGGARRPGGCVFSIDVVEQVEQEEQREDETRTTLRDEVAVLARLARREDRAQVDA